jgi:hypothetical protein
MKMREKYFRFITLLLRKSTAQFSQEYNSGGFNLNN